MKLMILDGNSIINRAYYGVRPLTTHDGLHTNAIFGFLNILQKLMHEEAPDAVCVAFDLHGPTFRHLKYDGYKATRKGMPDELAEQMPVMKEVLRAMRIPVYELQGYEADDIIGTVGKKCGAAGWDCVVITGDRDSLQLIDAHVTVDLIITRSGQTTTTRYNRDIFFEEYGLEPERIIDLKSLMGDSSDNIPGVAGIGQKTASSLLQNFGTTQNLYDNLDSPALRDSVRRKLTAGREMAFLSYDLATIRCDVPLEFKPENNLLQPWDRKALYDLFMRLEFVKLIDKYGLRSAAAELEPINSDTQAAVPAVLLSSGEEVDQQLADWARADYVCCLVLPELRGVGVLASGTVTVFLQSGMSDKDYERLLSGLFSSSIRKVSHAVKELQKLLLTAGLSSGGFVFDTALAAYFLDPSAGSYDLEKLSISCLMQELPSADLFSAENEWDEAGKAAALEAAAAHLKAVDTLYSAFSERLSEAGMDRLYFDTDLPLCAVLAEMEYTGVLVDRQALESFGQMLTVGIETVRSEIYGYAGREFNINSTKQLGEILFEELGLPHGKKTSRGWSTSIDVLNNLKNQHPIIQNIIDYRTLTKLKATYADGLLKEIAADGRIHTTFQNTVTATGRLSSTDPNLQNIPIRTELGGQIRKMFVAKPGWVLVDADYSQIELRVLAHIAGDTVMQQDFLSGEDIHRVTASQVFGVPLESVTSEMRRHAKAINFGIVYGMSEHSLAQDLGISYGEARAWMRSYLDRYAGVRDWMQRVVEQARQDGYVTTLMGRRRSLPELQSSSHNIRAGAERMALNTPIQGSAADIIKAAMLRVHAALREADLQARLLLQVHDELIVEAPESEAAQVQALVTREMEHVCTLSVPLIAEAHIAKDWYDAK